MDGSCLTPDIVRRLFFLYVYAYQRIELYIGKSCVLEDPAGHTNQNTKRNYPLSGHTALCLNTIDTECFRTGSLQWIEIRIQSEMSQFTSTFGEYKIYKTGSAPYSVRGNLESIVDRTVKVTFKAISKHKKIAENKRTTSGNFSWCPM